MATHSVEATRANLHGQFSRELAPILTINPGDTVRFQTLDASWGLAQSGPEGIERIDFTPRDPELDSGHALCGPIAIRGAQPGMTLVVRMGTLRPSPIGFTVAGNWDTAVNTFLGLGAGTGTNLLHWKLNVDHMTGQDQFGHTVALRPFLGVIGMPPAEPGYHPTPPPRLTGGNIDCKELVTGSTLYLPIAVPGGLVSVGDGHARQGDGEVSGVAIECPMDLAELTFDLRDDLSLTTPRAETSIGWLTFGFDESLDTAMMIALDGMLDLMRDLYGLERGEALALASVVVDLRITQVVNGVRGVHAVLPHDALVVSR